MTGTCSKPVWSRPSGSHRLRPPRFTPTGATNCATEALKVWIAGTKRGVTKAIHTKLKRRNAVEPVIGHMKSDGRLARNFLKGVDGDAMNALLCGAGHNMRKILKKLRLFCAQYSISLQTLLARLQSMGQQLQLHIT